VKSPKVFLRQPLMLGHCTPVIFSRNIRFEVWSNGSLHTQPPAVHGETTMNTVLAHTSGLAAIASILEAMNCAPAAGVPWF
jgi:hypothetical protein